MSRISVRKTYKLYIGGKFPRSESGRFFPVSDAQGGLVANLARASRKDLRDAVVAARKAQSGWAARTAFNRAQILYRIAEMLEGRAATFREILAAHAGYSDADAAAEVDAAIDRWVWYAGWCDKFPQVFGSVNPVAAPFFNFTAPAPVGVVTVFAPKEAPLLGLVSAVAPVLAGGNTCVVVVDNNAPHVAIELAEVLATSDVPGGVVNLLTGFSEELLPHAASHMDIDAIVGFGLAGDIRRDLEVAAAESVKRVKVFPALDATAWRAESAQSPYRILPFVEFQTAWHPVGK